MASPSGTKRKRCRRGGRKKKALSENVKISSSQDEALLSAAVAKAVEVLRKRRRKRCRRRIKKLAESTEASPSKMPCNPERPSIDSPVIEATENTSESRLSKSVSDLEETVRPPKRRKRKRKTKHISHMKTHNVGHFVSATAIQEIFIGDIVMFKRMILRDFQPHLETVTAKVFLKMKYGDQSSTDHDTLLIRPLIDVEPGTPHQESGHMGEPEFLKFEDMAEVMRKLTS